MGYNLYTDKANKFNCNIEIEGTSLAKSKVRLVIETDEMSYMFNGSIENTGVCEVNIPKTKHFLPEGTKGNMRLEVIADDVYFEPWSSDFSVKTQKKVNVVVQEQVEDKPKLRVQVFEQEQEKVSEKNEVVVETKNYNNLNNLPKGQKIQMKKQDLMKMLLGK
jgi:L-cysteine desulfidase